MALRLKDYSFSVLKNCPSNFDCNDDDLNDFFLNDAIKWQDILLTKTFCWHKNNDIIGFVSILNDTISLKGGQKRKKFQRSEHLCQYPGVKIGRLGIDKKYQNHGLGSQILKFMKMFMVVKNKTGCRFITIDAYNKPDVLKFYEKNNFLYLTKEDEKDKTRIMYYDLIKDYNQIKEDQKLYTELNKSISNIIY